MRGRGPAPGEIQLPVRLDPGETGAWSRGGQPVGFLSDGPTSTGSVISGASTGELSIGSFTRDDEDEYVYWVSFDGNPLEPVLAIQVYVDRNIPDVTHSPRSREACVGGTESFRVEAFNASGFEWTWNAQPLQDGVLPTDGGPPVLVAGADTAELTLIGLSAEAEGELACTVFSDGDENSRDVEIFPFDLTISSNTVAPSIVTEPPAMTTVQAGGDAEISLEAMPATPDAFVTYQWFKDGSPIFGDGRVFGTNFPDLLIENVELSDAGVYECLVTQACGSVTSLPAVLTVTCRADTNGNGTLDPGDFTAWVVAYNAGNLPTADQNDNDELDPGDFTAWIAAYNLGC